MVRFFVLTIAQRSNSAAHDWRETRIYTDRDNAELAAALKARRDRIAADYSNGPVRDVTAMVQAAAAVAEKPDATAADVAAAVHSMRAAVQDIAGARRRRAEEVHARHYSAGAFACGAVPAREAIATESWGAAARFACTAFGPLAPLNAHHGVAPDVDQLVDQLCQTAGLVAG